MVKSYWYFVKSYFVNSYFVNPFTTGNPFLGTKLLGFSIGRGSGALKGLSAVRDLILRCRLLIILMKIIDNIYQV